MNCTQFVRHSLTIGCSFFMTKFTSEDKMNAVIHYQDGSESIKDIANYWERTTKWFACG